MTKYATRARWKSNNSKLGLKVSFTTEGYNEVVPNVIPMKKSAITRTTDHRLILIKP